MFRNRFKQLMAGLLVVTSVLLVGAVIALLTGQAATQVQGAGNQAQQVPSHPTKLVNASNDELGRLGVQYAQSLFQLKAGMPQPVLVRPVTFEEVTQLGLGYVNLHSIERPLAQVYWTL